MKHVKTAPHAAALLTPTPTPPQGFERQLYYDSLKGVAIGQLNHSDAFFFAFRSDVYNELHNRLLDFLSTPQPAIGNRKPPLAVAADKMTALRRTNQTVGLFTIDYAKGEIVVSFAGARLVSQGEGSGEGVARNLLAVLSEECKMTPDMIKQQTTGQAYDGAYFHCSVPSQVASKIGHGSEEWTRPGWDPAHQLELVWNDTRKDPNVAWYGDMADKVARVTVKARWGKNHERALAIAKDLLVVLADVSGVCETRFTASERKVYTNVLKNWKTLLTLVEELKAQEKERGEKKVLGNLVSLMRSQAWLVQLMGLTDIMRVVKDVSLFAQKVNALEWEKVESQQAAHSRLRDTFVPALESGNLAPGDFPWLAMHSRELKAATWQGEKLQIIGAAASDPLRGYAFALKNIRMLVITLTGNWFSRILAPSKLYKQYQWMSESLDLRKLIQPASAATATATAATATAATATATIAPTVAPTVAATATVATVAAIAPATATATVAPTDRAPPSLMVKASPSLEVEEQALKKLYDWTLKCGVINSLLPTFDVLFKQHKLLRTRLMVAASQSSCKGLWALELKGGGSGTTIMRWLFTTASAYCGVEDWLFFFNHMALKTANEAVIESMGCIVDQHAAPGRHLAQPKYAEEAFIHWNGPRPHEATKLLSQALDRHFKGKEWHFVKKDRPAHWAGQDVKQFKISKVVDRLSSEHSRLSFMAD